MCCPAQQFQTTWNIILQVLVWDQGLDLFGLVRRGQFAIFPRSTAREIIFPASRSKVLGAYVPSSRPGLSAKVVVGIQCSPQR